MKIDLYTFKVNVTPPIGHYLCGGLGAPMLEFGDPLYLRGWVLKSDSRCCVIASIDYCYMIGRSQWRFEQALAEAAGTAREHVVIQATHAHNAPLVNEEAHAILAEFDPSRQCHDEAYFSDVLQRTGNAVRACMEQQSVVIGGVGFASSTVHEFASTRRVLDEQGKAHPRYSVCRDPALRDKPVGRIDPLLDQIVLYDEDKNPVTCASFFACHPQVSTDRYVISGDTVGLALDMFEKQYPHVFPLYFDGCGGDVTAGKYTTLNLERNRYVFGVRLFDGIEAAFHAARPSPLERWDWVDRTYELPLQTIVKDQDYYQQQIAEGPEGRRYLAACKLHRLREGIDRYPFRVSCLRFNRMASLFMPTELCVDYQLFAKSQHVGPLAVAAYGDSFLNYVATARAFDEGGYEVMPEWTEVDRRADPLIRSYIADVLGESGG